MGPLKLTGQGWRTILPGMPPAAFAPYASAACASGYTAPTWGCRCPSSTRRASSISWARLDSWMKMTVLMLSRPAGGGSAAFTETSVPPGRSRARRPGQHVAADRVEHQVGPAVQIIETVGVQRDEAVGAQLRDQRPGVAAPGPDHLGAGPAGQLDRRRSDRAARAVDDHRLSLGQLSVVEQG